MQQFKGRVVVPGTCTAVGALTLNIFWLDSIIKREVRKSITTD